MWEWIFWKTALALSLSIPVLARSLARPPESHCLHVVIIPLLSFFFLVFSLSLSLPSLGDLFSLGRVIANKFMAVTLESLRSARRIKYTCVYPPQDVADAL